jgi:hypothetical protein
MGGSGLSSLRGHCVRTIKKRERATNMTSAANHLRTSEAVRGRFDHASTLPRKACLADIDQARVYFIAGAGLIKIGISTNITSRFRSIRNSSPVPLELLGSFPGTTMYEGWLHRKFAHLRRHGEWFEDAAELRDEIERRLR